MFDVFISHSSAQKELGRIAHYNAISNGMSSWFDEDMLNYGDQLKATILKGIEQSKCFLLLHSKEAMETEWVALEMQAARAKYETSAEIKIIVVKLDETPLDEWWKQFLYQKWDATDQPGSVLRLLEGILGRKIISPIAAASVLSAMPSTLFLNSTQSVAEHTRNYALFYMAHVKQLLQAIVTMGDYNAAFQTEHQDTLRKLLKLSLMEKLPALHGGWMPVSAGEYEIIHGNRSRIVPRVEVQNLPARYAHSVTYNDEISTRIKFVERTTGIPVLHAIPFSVMLDAEL